MTRGRERSIGRASGRGFTLVEILISIGALALIAVGLATVFQVTGRTVEGGRSVSAFTAYARIIERQMREDLDAISRDGFLVIVHENADQGRAVPLFEGQRPPQQRARRTDELMFFARGDFASARDPLYDGYAARAKEARIYYGHGRRAYPNLASLSSYRVPGVGDSNADSRTHLGANSVGNPNRYAASWTLLRHQTLLAGPSATVQSLPPPTTGLDVPDSDIQRGLQPAAASIFRSVSNVDPCEPPFPTTVRQSFGGGNARPMFASGLVDVATTDLSEIRAYVMTAANEESYVDTNETVEPEDDTLFIRSITPAMIENCNHIPRPNNQLGILAYPVQQAWMLDAFPGASQDYEAFSDWVLVPYPFTPRPVPIVTRRTVTLGDRERVRYEASAPDFFGASSQPLPVTASYRVSDQAMLSASNFLPRCTEFIVEWSFGKVYPRTDPRAGQFIWHGKRRDITTPTGTRTVADLYQRGVDAAVDQMALAYRLRSASAASAYGQWPVDPGLIHGEAATLSTPTTVDYSFFGFVDPGFDPDDPDANPGTMDESATPTTPWAWPELLRVTISLGHPTDPSIEETFQFVLAMPGTPEP